MYPDWNNICSLISFVMGKKKSIIYWYLMYKNNSSPNRNHSRTAEFSDSLNRPPFAPFSLTVRIFLCYLQYILRFCYIYQNILQRVIHNKSCKSISTACFPLWCFHCKLEWQHAIPVFGLHESKRVYLGKKVYY